MISREDRIAAPGTALRAASFQEDGDEGVATGIGRRVDKQTFRQSTTRAAWQDRQSGRIPAGGLTRVGLRSGRGVTALVSQTVGHRCRVFGEHALERGDLITELKLDRLQCSEADVIRLRTALFLHHACLHDRMPCLQGLQQSVHMVLLFDDFRMQKSP